ncbi:MAG TPA: OmpA family protein [Polyangia bacterium]|nr:OmpA family protein [Polyangia bacterium]
MKTKVTGWMVGGMALLFGSAAGAAEMAADPMDSGASATASSAPACRDIGITVSFDSGSYELNTNAKGALNGVAQWMAAKESRTLKLAGHTDISGDPGSNQTLSDKRADAVKDYLLQHGVDGSRISAVGHGEELAGNLPASGRTVTFMGCDKAVMAQQETAPPPAPAAAAEPEAVPPPEPAEAPVAELPPPAPVVTPVPAPMTDYDTAPAKSHGYGSAVGFAVLFGGGYTDFTNQRLRDATSAGGDWAVRLVVGTKSYVGFEAAYVGSARSIQPLGLSTNADLVSSGGQGALRLNIPIVSGDMLIEPYGFAGIGFAHYWITNYSRTTLSDLSASDNIMTVPVGGGISFAHRALMVDVRGSWVPTYYNNLLATTGGNLNTWGVNGNIGVAF